MKNTFNTSYHHFAHENAFFEKCNEFLDGKDGRVGVWFKSSIIALGRVFAISYSSNRSLATNYFNNQNPSNKSLITNIAALGEIWGVGDKRVIQRLDDLQKMNIIIWKRELFRREKSKTYIAFTFDERQFFCQAEEESLETEKAAKIVAKQSVELPIF